MVKPIPDLLTLELNALIVSSAIFLYKLLLRIFPKRIKLKLETEFPLGIAPSYISLARTINSSEFLS